MLATQPLLAAAKPCGARRGRSACRSPAPLGGSYARIRSHGSPCGLVVPAPARASGFRALRAPLRRPRLFYRCAQNNSGPRRLYLRIREERQIVAPRRRPPGTPPRNPAQLAGASGGGCGARPSRLRAGALRARPRCPRGPLLRSPWGSLRRGRSALISPLPSANPRDRGTGALHEAERKRSSLVRRTT